MARKKLDKKHILNVCKIFIKGRGYACRLDIDEDTKKYLLRYNYIYTQPGLPKDFYFLDKKFYAIIIYVINCKKGGYIWKLIKFII